MSEIDINLQLAEIFYPYRLEKANSLYPENKEPIKFVHYTSAEAALSIIETKKIWMRTTSCMSDYSEVRHGFNMLNKFFEQNTQEFISTLDKYSPGAAQEAIDLFNRWWANIEFNTYVTSISEHDDEENIHGRLSMWRAFGGNNTRVAIVLKIPVRSLEAEALKIDFSPVGYHTEEEVLSQMKDLIGSIERNGDFLNSLQPQLVRDHLFQMLFMSVTCNKHKGFAEEREWRAIYTPRLHQSAFLKQVIKVINGVPQPVYEIPLDGSVLPGVRDLEFSSLFDSLIIGPTSYPVAVFEAFKSVLEEAGVNNPQIHTSGIPLRT